MHVHIHQQSAKNEWQTWVVVGTIYLVEATVSRGHTPFRLLRGSCGRGCGHARLWSHRMKGRRARGDNLTLENGDMVARQKNTCWTEHFNSMLLQTLMQFAGIHCPSTRDHVFLKLGPYTVQEVSCLAVCEKNIGREWDYCARALHPESLQAAIGP